MTGLACGPGNEKGYAVSDGSPREVHVSSRPRVAALAAGIALFASGCAKDAPQTVLEPEGPVARQLDKLWDPVFLVATVVFVIIHVLLLVIIVKFRRRSDDDAPVQTHGNAKAELAWTIAPALVLAILGFLTVGTIFDINERPAGADVEQVKVIGHQWWWEYQYGEHDIVTANELVIPVGAPVDLELTSDDVIHSFWPPKLAGKVDTIPGRTNHMTVQADRPGMYWGQCAEYCGESHGWMRLRVRALSAADYEQWIEDQQKEQDEILAAGEAPPAAEEGVALSDEELAANGYSIFMGTGGCAGCHTVAGTPAAGKIGPNLTHLFSRSTFAGSIFDLNEENLRKWLRDPQAEKPGNKMQIRNLSEEEITQLIAYLETLK